MTGVGWIFYHFLLFTIYYIVSFVPGILLPLNSYAGLGNGMGEGRRGQGLILTRLLLQEQGVGIISQIFLIVLLFSHVLSLLLSE